MNDINNLGTLLNNVNALICVFCQGIVANHIDYTKTQICVECHDYKGITTVKEYLEEFHGVEVYA